LLPAVYSGYAPYIRVRQCIGKGINLRHYNKLIML
jgi:hypothetical protein